MRKNSEMLKEIVVKPNTVVNMDGESFALVSSTVFYILNTLC